MRIVVFFYYEIIDNCIIYNYRNYELYFRGVYRLIYYSFNFVNYLTPKQQLLSTTFRWCSNVIRM